MDKNLGRVAPVPVGEFTEETVYNEYDLVSFEGGSYLSKVGDNNFPLSDETKWFKTAERGGQGIQGEPMMFQDLTPEQKEELKGDVLDYTIMTEAQKEELANLVPVNGVVVSGNTNAVSGGEVFESLPEYLLNVNLFNTNDVQENKYINNSGTIYSEVGWYCSKPIPVEQVDYYLSGSRTRSGVVFLATENATSGRYLNTGVGLVQPQAGENFVVFNLKSASSAMWSEVQFEKGSSATPYQPYSNIKVINKNGVEGLNQVIIETENIKEKTDPLSILVDENANLINPADMFFDSLLISGGVTQESTTYNTTQFINIESNTLYTGLRLDSTNIFRYTSFYSEPNASSFISSITSAHTLFTTPVNANYVRTSILKTSANDMTKVGLFKGVSPTWKPYGINIILNEVVTTDGKISESIAQIRDIEYLINNSNSGFNYKLNNNNLTVTYDLGELNSSVKRSFSYTENPMYNLTTSSLKGVNVSSGDDVAPIHVISNTIGANHGYTKSYIATINTHGFTNVDIGTEFLRDGIKFYILRIVDANRVQFMSENLGNSISPSFTTLTNGIISRGGVDYNINSVTEQQLYPSIGELKTNILANDKNIVNTNNEGKTNKLNVIENYLIYHPVSVLNNTIARAGQSSEPTMLGNGLAKINNIYSFVDKATIIYTNVQFLDSVIFSDIMCSQNIRIGANDGVTKYYLPNSNPLNESIDLRKPTAITWSSSIPSTFIINSEQPEPNNPPNRVIQYRGDLGFMMCYILTRGQGKDVHNYTNRTFEIRSNTGKIYPHAVEGSKVGTTTSINDSYSIAMAKVYTDLTKTRIGNRLSVFSFKVDNETHVYIDYSGNMVDNIFLDDLELNGKKIEILESKNTTLKNNVYNSGFVVKSDYVEGETCYMVVVIK